MTHATPSPRSPSRREFVIRLAAVTASLGAASALTACGGDGGDPPTFNHGVASGDPLADRVILWTHAQFAGSNEDVALTWEVATDASFASLVASGSVAATAAKGHTAKVDATGLKPGTDYRFRFRWGNHSSPVGVTRTLPATGANRLAMAVMSCSNYPAGHFNAYAEVARSEARYAVHLGDFIYEYSADGYASTDAKAMGRVVDPTHECITLADYRKRYAQYRTDPDSKVLLATMPLIAIWDDHEIANDTYKDGAENHTPGNEGLFATRRDAALQAWHEWMPVRTPDATDLRKIYRSFDFGGLAALHMLETRVLARDKPIGFDELLNPTTASQAKAQLASPSRTLMGATQLQWLQVQMAASSATWQVLGQQVLMARMAFPVSILQYLNPDNLTPQALVAAQQAITDYLTAKATAAQAPALLTAEQKALLDPALNPTLGYNLDAWDGYPVEREVLLSSAQQLGKKLVVLAGDTHNAWCSRLTLANGSVVGQEFATQSISSPGLEEYLSVLPPAQVQQIFLGVVNDLRYADTARRGFLLMTFTPTEAKGTWHFVSTVKSRTYTVDSTATVAYRG